MSLKSLIAEFEHEAANTCRLLQAVPQKDLAFKPSPISWNMGELSQHIATIFYWYVGALTKDVYDISADRLERGDPGDIQTTLQLFESNVEKANRHCSPFQKKASGNLDHDIGLRPPRDDREWTKDGPPSPRPPGPFSRLP